MSFKNVFKRYEFKYILDIDKAEYVLKAISRFIYPDDYGKTTIRNLYFDTDSYLLIRRSIEKPTTFKEKIRIRSYSKADDNTTVFIELKRKYKSLVYKRRLPIKYFDAIEWLSGSSSCPSETQISKEIDYFISYYKTLKPSALIFYDREAYYSKERQDFRITFDSNILFNSDSLSLSSKPSGVRLLPEDKVLMEIKCVGGMPLWMVEVLSKESLYKIPFSKYGTAYKNYIYNNLEVSKNGENI